MTEEWRDVPGYEGLYRVSNLGRIRSTARRGARGGDRAANVADTGYLCVTLYRECRKKRFAVHRLVAIAFLEPDDRPGLHVRHLDGDRRNNVVTNLAWGTPAENAADMIRHGTNHNTRKTHCIRGHALAGDNLAFNDVGGRVCRTCRRAITARSNAKRRAA